MSTEDEDIQTRADRIAKELNRLEPNHKQQKQELFSRLYPTITERLAANVTQKDILALLAANGLKLHASRFKELMQAEEMARSNGTTVEEGAEQ